MVWEAGNRRREFLKLAAFSLAGLTTTSARGLYQAQRDVIPRPGVRSARWICWSRATSVTWPGTVLVPGRSGHSQSALGGHHEPFAAVLSCADARVPVELVFDQSIGHLSWCVWPAMSPAGHHRQLGIWCSRVGSEGDSCSGTYQLRRRQGYLAGKAVPEISTLFQYIHPAIAGANGDVTTASRQNALLQASVLRETSPVLADLVKQKKLAVRAAMYDVGNGKVTML